MYDLIAKATATMINPQIILEGFEEGSIDFKIAINLRGIFSIDKIIQSMILTANMTQRNTNDDNMSHKTADALLTTVVEEGHVIWTDGAFSMYINLVEG